MVRVLRLIIYGTVPEGRDQMDLSVYREYLQQRSLSLVEQDQDIALVSEFEIFSQESGASPAGWTARAFIAELTRTCRDSHQNLLALARYGHFLNNDEIYVAALELLDGAEVMDNLSQKLSTEVGPVRRDAIFASIPLPTPGTSGAEKAARMQAVVDRMERMLDPAICHRVLGDGLRNLKDEWYLDERRKYQECGGIDAYLVRKKQDLITELERIQAEGGLYFSQPVTSEVLDFVRCTPEIGGGVRQNNILYVVKIPYQAHEYVTAADDLHRRYAYCHCPWVRESLRPDSRLPQVSATFCQCSLGFIKKPWEVIFDRHLEAEVVSSVLEGDMWCKIAVHLPEDVLQGEVKNFAAVS
jgi:hypothetical protein